MGALQAVEQAPSELAMLLEGVDFCLEMSFQPNHRQRFYHPLNSATISGKRLLTVFVYKHPIDLIVLGAFRDP